MFLTILAGILFDMHIIDMDMSYGSLRYSESYPRERYRCFISVAEIRLFCLFILYYIYTHIIIITIVVNFIKLCVTEFISQKTYICTDVSASSVQNTPQYTTVNSVKHTFNFFYLFSLRI